VDKAVDKVQFGVVQMKCFPVNVTVHIRLARKIFVGQLSATIASIPDSSSSLMDWVARIIAALCLRHVFALHHIIADRLVLDEEPRFVEQEELGVPSFLGSVISFDARCKT